MPTETSPANVRHTCGTGRYLLNPGHVGGALEVRHILQEELCCPAHVIIAETGDLMYACRMVREGEIFQSGIKQHVAVAALPAADTPRLMEILGPIFPCLHPAGSILETGFEGGGAMLHPIPKPDESQPHGPCPEL